MIQKNKTIWNAAVIVGALFVLCLVVIFFWTNTAKISWIQKEMLWHSFFWSMDGVDTFTLHTGLRPADAAKPFIVKYVDGDFRTRQFSYFIEMLSFKFWQSLTLAFPRNYTLIILHLLTVALIGYISFLLTGSVQTALVAFGLSLNSGIALGTLMFPFRNAKVLVSLLFFLAWAIVLRAPKPLHKAKLSTIICFFCVVLCAMLTDEGAYFIIPALMFYIFHRDGKESFCDKRMLVGMGAVAGMFVATVVFTWAINRSLVSVEYPPAKHMSFLIGVGEFLVNPRTYRDLFVAFTAFFLKRNFGCWDKTLLGVCSAVAAGVLVVRVLINKKEKHIVGACFFLGITVLVKALLLPHNSGVHAHIMPEGTVFPSLFFFGFYYVYFEAVAVSMIVALLLHKKRQRRLMYAAVCIAVIMISAANAHHFRQGPRDALSFGNWDAYKKEKVANCVDVKEYISQREKVPVYLSFPAGEEKIVKGRRHDNVPNLYAAILPIAYLSEINKGNVILSYDNVGKKSFANHSSELFAAKTFLDVRNKETYDLQRLLETVGKDALRPVVAEGAVPVIPPTKVEAPFDHIVFFVKGESRYLLSLGALSIPGKQTYGNAYQMFLMWIDPQTLSFPFDIRLAVTPKGVNQKVSVIGPFAINE